MTTITLQDIKKHGAKALPDDRVCTLIVNSKPKGVFVPPHLYEPLIEALEDLEDLELLREYEKNKDKEELIPFEEAFPEFQK